MSPGQPLVRDPVATLDDPPAVDDHRVGHRVERLVEGGELVPVGDDDGAVGAGEGGVRGVGVIDVVEVLFGVLCRDRIVRGHGRAALSEPADHRDRAGVPHVVSARFECESEDGDTRTVGVDVVGRQLDQSFGFAVVHLDGRAEQRWFVARLDRGRDDRSDVLWETGTAPPDPTAEESVADPVVQTDRVRELVRVDAHRLTDVSEFVNEAHLRREKAIVRVLDHLRRACVRLHEWSVRLQNKQIGLYPR